jgi:hypothetical protein
MERILEDSSVQCCVRTSRDMETITTRIKHEGLSFLTITLPNFCRDFERSLDQGFIDELAFLGFKKNKGLPAFLQGFLSLVFDRYTGRLLHNPSVAAIFCVRQLCLAFKKYRSPCTKQRDRSAIENYVLTDLGVEDFESRVPEHFLEVFSREFFVIFHPILSTLERSLETGDITVLPKHGPGTTADGTKSNRKFDWNTWTQRLDEHFPFYEYLIPNLGFVNDDLPITILEPGQEPPVRVITVPKTLKTPRIIAVEPVHMQYVQQGLLEILVPLLESRAMHNSLGFSDQSLNQELARIGSSSGFYATLDLSEASDRVSNLLVSTGFSHWKTLSSMIQACRTTKADVPGFGIIPISKFASMGSALCFPIEAMVFLTIYSIAYRERQQRLGLEYNREVCLQGVRIYGDDIIVPVELAQDVARELSNFNLKVNEHKSFWTGKFRESCGGDYYDGDEVKPTYVKTEVPGSRVDVEAFESTVSTRNQFYRNGFWRTARFIDTELERIAPFPHVSETSSVLGRHSFLPLQVVKLCRNLHRPIVRGLIRRSVKPVDVLDGPGALMKFFLKRGSEPFFSKDHLKRDGRPKIATLHLRWAPSS